MLKTLVFNGWAAGHEAWDLCTFEHDWVFDYVEQLDGLPARVLEDTDDALLVGFSMGGATALQMALRFPQKVRGLVLVSATARMMADRATGWPGMSERRLEALRLGTRLVFAQDPSPLYAPENLERGLAFLRETDLRDALRRQAGAYPVALFHSERDGIVRPDNARFLKEVFPQATLTWLPGAEHVLPVTAPEPISAAVEAMQDAYAEKEEPLHEHANA